MIILKILAVPAGNDYIEMSAKGFEEISPQRKYHGISTQISSVLFLLPKMWTCRRMCMIGGMKRREGQI